MYEVQAVLDLYLGEMRRVEDEEKRPVPSWRWKAPSTTPKAPETCRNGKCGHYPRLVLEGFEGNKQAKAKDVRDSSATVQDATTQSANGPTSQEQSASAKGEQTVFVVTQAQATEHCARRGAHTDHFDSPFIFASSDLKMLSRDSQRRIIVEHDEYEGRDYYYSDYDELDSDYEGPVFPYNDDEFSQPESPTSRSPRSSSVASTPLEPLTSPPPEIFDRTRRNDLLSLARSVINLALGLRTLSVTGWLSRCLDRKAPDLSNLNSLSLGPILPPRSTYDAIYEVPLPNLSKLRFAGHELCSWAVERFSKEESKLPNLRRFEWEYGGSKLTRPFGRSLEVV